MTCRLDVVELLEKRVKSRYSHRQILLYPNDHDDEDNLLEANIENITSSLSIGSFYCQAKHNLSSSCVNQWNKQIQELMKNKSFRSIIQRLMDIDVTKNQLKIALVLFKYKLFNSPFYIYVFRLLSFLILDMLMRQ